jgi:hypothetical protein
LRIFVVGILALDLFRLLLLLGASSGTAAAGRFLDAAAAFVFLGAIVQ